MINNKFFIIIILILLGIAGVKLYTRLNEEDNNNKNNIQTSSALSKAQITIYTKEGCIYCTMAKTLLDERGDGIYEVIDLSFNKDLYLKLANQTGQTTVPYIFINDKFIGGYQDLLKLTETNASPE